MAVQLSIIDLVDKNLSIAALNNDRDYTYFHASAWGKCHRKIAYEYYEAKGYITVANSSLKISPRLERIFGNGHSMHDRWRQYIEATGMLRGRWECSSHTHDEPKIYGAGDALGCLRPGTCDCGGVDFRYREVGFSNAETLLGGHVDAILDLGCIYPDMTDKPDAERNIVVDFKSMNMFEFKKLKAPTKEHIVQMQLYLYLSGVKEGRFLYENKNDQDVKEFIVPRDQNFIDENVKKAKLLKYIVEHTNSSGQRALPKRGYDSRGNFNCLNCKFRGDCWK